jgi:hypothetical protein
MYVLLCPCNSLTLHFPSSHQLSKLEMHGTGTPLGDPIELGAAAAVLNNVPAPLRDGTSSKSIQGIRATPVTFTALKADMGHAEPAAGADECFFVITSSYMSGILTAPFIKVQPCVFCFVRIFCTPGLLIRSSCSLIRNLGSLSRTPPAAASTHLPSPPPEASEPLLEQLLASPVSPTTRSSC